MTEALSSFEPGNANSVVWAALLRVKLNAQGIVSRREVGEVTVILEPPVSGRRALTLFDFKTKKPRIEAFVDERYFAHFLAKFVLTTGRLILPCFYNEGGKVREAEVILDAVKVVRQ